MKPILRGRVWGVALGLLAVLLAVLLLGSSAARAQDLPPAEPTPFSSDYTTTEGQPTAVTPQSGVIGNIIPWDFGKTFDNLQYQATTFIATQVYLPHALLLTSAYYLDRIAQILTQGLLPLALTVIVTLLAETNIFLTVGTLAVLLFGLSLVVSFLDWRPVDLSRVAGYLVLAALLLAQGPAFMTMIETGRRSLARTVYDRTYASVYADGEWGGALSGLAAPTEWASFQLRDYYEPGINVLDVALSALAVTQGEQSSGALPAALQAQFFPHTSGIANLPEGQRSVALQNAGHGVARILLAYPLSVVAVVEAAMELLFSIAGFFLLLAIPLALVLSFFAPTEGVFLGLLQKYVTLILNYVVVSALISIGVAALVAAVIQGSLVIAIAGSMFAALFYSFGWSLALNSAKSSMFALSGALATSLGVKDPVAGGLDAAQSTMGLGVGLAGAAVATAAGMPMLAPAMFNIGGQMKPFGDLTAEQQSQADYRPGLETAKGLMRSGLGIAGGSMMRGTPVANPATAVNMLSGMSDGMGGMVRETPASDAVMVGLTTNAANPVGLALALDRTARRRGNLNRRYGGADAGNAPAPPTPRDTTTPMVQEARPPSAPAPYQPDPVSPWRTAIDEGIRNYGDAWATHIAQALRDMKDYLAASGQSPESIAQHFANAQGQPDLRTSGGRALFDHLDAETRQTLRDPAAQAAVAGLIGETVMPRVEVHQREFFQAIGQAVEDGGVSGAEAVARRLGSTPTALGSAYGPVNAIVERARDLGLSAAETEMTLYGDIPPQHVAAPGIAQLAAQGRMLPNSVSVLQTAVTPASVGTMGAQPAPAPSPAAPAPAAPASPTPAAPAQPAAEPGASLFSDPRRMPDPPEPPSTLPRFPGDGGDS